MGCLTFAYKTLGKFFGSFRMKKDPSYMLLCVAMCWSISDPYNAEIQSKRLMGKGSKTLIADEFHKDCQQLQK